jgi:biopolymer transport protein ExbD
VPYGTAVRVLAETKGAGVTKIGMVTVPMEEEQREKRQR